VPDPKTCKMTKDGEVRDMPLHFDHSHQCYLDRGWTDVDVQTDPPDAGVAKPDAKPKGKAKGKQLPLDEGT